MKPARKPGRGLRYASIEAMPDSMRRAIRLESVPATVEAGDARRKYGNCPTRVDGIRFDSKREARYYERLKLEREAGLVAYFLRQVPIHLPGGTKLVVDFQVFYTDGSVRYLDSKGVETAVFKVKKREVEHLYPLKVECV